MEKRIIVVREIIIVKSIIGLHYRPMDNSQITLDDCNITGRLYGCVTEIVSEPYIGRVYSFDGSEEKRLCIKVRSLDSGLIYQVPFHESRIEESEKTLHETIIGRTLKINDNSYAIRITTNKHVSLFRQCLTIISKPYVWFDPEGKRRHLMVNVVDSNGYVYRVLFNEDGLIDKYNKTFCP